MTSVRELLRVGPAVNLKDIDPGSTPGLPGRKVTGRDQKVWAREQLALIGGELAVHQEMLYASAKGSGGNRRVLLVLQAMDCGGKDGTIKKVAGAMNPLGLHLVGFGPPSEEELKHDFLWRIRRALPSAGLMGVFNRSHYEDVLIARVDSLVPADVWRERYGQINAFERELTGDGFTLVKVMLHISYDEQRERLLERLTDPTKHWKYNPADVDARARWTDYQAAYTDALGRCSTDHAPWFVVPADRKWYRDWAVANIVLETFKEMRLSYPEPDFDLDAERQRLEADRAPAMAS
ncbi:PPK2 family polyphosphate kinase [Phytohabitans suffuscus]|uniref:Polyphosphate--nucleotide phosphotransferase n=1 Tax=Phytohabitans suffuscus TaxID=624315 RepID=A0A6F8YHE8_9ACTN|nr:PPK2 family polyphosphate kinase [Phytohabitans suffuscus]BCB85510.1 polyphosphate--nucleotide phosphotransferase [Phytohabitans suffuscus]